MKDETKAVSKVSLDWLFWSVSSLIRTEYGDLVHKSPCSVQIQENAGQKNAECRHFLFSAIC